MKVLNTPEVVTTSQERVTTRARRRVVAVIATVAAFLCALAAPASATPAPTGAEDSIESGFGQLQNLVTGTLGLALFGIVIAILGITMGVRWLRKGSSTG